MTMGNEEREEIGRNEMSDRTAVCRDGWSEVSPHVYAVCGYRKGHEGRIQPVVPVLFRKEEDAKEYMRHKVDTFDTGPALGHGGVFLQCYDMPVRDGLQPPGQNRCFLCGAKMDRVTTYIDSPMSLKVHTFCEGCTPALYRTIRDLKRFTESPTRWREE